MFALSIRSAAACPSQGKGGSRSTRPSERYWTVDQRGPRCRAIRPILVTRRCCGPRSRTRRRRNARPSSRVESPAKPEKRGFPFSRDDCLNHRLIYVSGRRHNADGTNPVLHCPLHFIVRFNVTPGYSERPDVSAIATGNEKCAGSKHSCVGQIVHPAHL